MSAPPILLILDDDEAFSRAAGQLAMEEGFRVQFARELREAREFLARSSVDLLFLDLNLPDGSGLDLLEDMRLGHHGQVAVITGSPSLESAIRAVSSPAVHYFSKPVRANAVLELLQRTMQRHWHDRTDEAATVVDRIAGNSVSMRDLMRTVMQVASSDASVMLSGEIGTGKSLLARALHEASGRKGPFVTLNCEVGSTDQLISQLFGYNACTGQEALGLRCETSLSSSCGTLFLRNVTHLRHDAQAVLLEALERQEDPNPGTANGSAAPVRLISSFAPDGEGRKSAGNLRPDLYYRLAHIPLRLPPLRSRGDDPVLLANLFIGRLNREHRDSKRLQPGSESDLLRYPWPGNVRELKNAVERAYLTQRCDLIRVLPGHHDAAGEGNRYEMGTADIQFRVGTTLAEMERQAVRATLSHFNNDKPAAARALGVSLRTIYNHVSRMSASN